MKNIKYTSLYRIFDKLLRDLGLEDINESDIIEWSGEALEAINAPRNYEEAVAFLEVKNYKAELPQGTHSIIQIAKNNEFEDSSCCIKDIYDEVPTVTSIKKEIICEKIITQNTQTEENNFPFVGCVPINVSFSCPPNKTIFSIDFSTYLGGITNSFDNFLNDLASNPLPKTYSYFELQGYLKANNVTITSVNNPSYGYIEFEVNHSDIIDDYNNTFNSCTWHTSIACQNQQGVLQPYMGAYLKFNNTTILAPTITYKTLTRITTLDENSKIIKTEYLDAYGTSYTPSGEILNCPDRDCNPCLTFCEKPDILVVDKLGNYVGDLNYANYFILPILYTTWNNTTYYKDKYTPIRLATNSFASELFCANEDQDENIYKTCKDEYTLFDDTLKFSFEKGLVAVAYNKTITDKETGFPMIPDTYSYTTAITKYVTMKLMEKDFYNGRQGADRRLQKAEQDWQWYCKQASNELFMINGVDEHENLLEQRQFLLPKQNHYYGFFGKFNNAENRRFNTRRNATSYRR